MNRERDSRFELLRVIAMAGIIIMHYMNTDMGGVSSNAIFPNFVWFFSQISLSLCVPLVNCFVLISGYFLNEKTEFSLRKPVELICITSFYGIGMYLISLILKTNSLSIRGLLFAIFPFFIGKRWFVETYIILLLYAPFINKGLELLSKQAFEILLTVQILIFSVWYSLGLSSPVLDDGYGITNFLTLYMIGAYIAKYGRESSLLNKLSKMNCLILYIGFVMVTFVLSFFMNPFGYSFITVVLASVFLFLGFYKIAPWNSKLTNKVSGFVFDTYFVHSDSNTAAFLFIGLLKTNLICNSIWMIPHLLISIIVIFALGIVVGKMRKILFSFTIDKWIQRISVLSTNKSL